MSVNVITGFVSKPDRTDELLALLFRVLPQSRAHEGCEGIYAQRSEVTVSRRTTTMAQSIYADRVQGLVRL